MKAGVYIFPTAYSIGIAELARELEGRGLESLFVPEHTHIPACRETPWPGGGPLPREYAGTLDPFVGLAVAASATTRLRVGTGICLLTERDPIVTAKAVATLDLLSAGRLELGIGAGWNREEMANHGTRFETRFRVMVERAKAMQVIWTEEEASFHGEFVEFDRVWSWPKPVQRPHPPILLGGESDHTLRRVVEFCSGWMPRGRIFAQPEREMARLASHAEARGRDPAGIAVTVFGAPPEPAFIERCATAGVARILFALPSEGRDTLLPMLDEQARLAERLPATPPSGDAAAGTGS